MNNKSTLIRSYMRLHQNRTYSKLLKTLGALSLLFLVLVAGCKKDKFAGELVGDCPVVVSDPMDLAVDVVLNKVITITFNTDMDPGTINDQTFFIKQGTTLVPGTIAATASAKIYTFTPTVALLPFTKYNGTVTMGAKDPFKTSMLADYLWSFTTIPVVSTSANPIAGGTSSGAGSYAQGASATVAAVPNTGFIFVNWTENGTVVSTSSSYQFTMAGNRTLVANFAPIPVGNFAVVLSSNPIVGGTNTGSGAYATGTAVTVTATPNPGYTFINWTDNGNVVSSSSSYQFTITANRTLVANYRIVPATQFAVVLSSNPVIGGSTSGSGSFNGGTSVTITAAANTGYSFVNWTDNGVIVSTSATYIFVLSANRNLVANFAINTYTLTVNAQNGSVLKVPLSTTYNYGSVVTLTPTANTGYTFTSWTGDASGNAVPLTVLMTSNKVITANFTANAAVGPAPINLGSAANYTILTKAGISTTGVTFVQGDIGVSPIVATAITGFDLIHTAGSPFAKSLLVSGSVYAADYGAPTPVNLTTAISDMETAFNNGMAVVTPSPQTEKFSGALAGQTLAPGLYKWSTAVSISNGTLTLNGGANDTWIMQVSQDMILGSNASINLTGGAKASNVFWVVAGKVTLGSNSTTQGIVMSKTLVEMTAGAKVTGRLLAQTAVTMISNTITAP